MDLIDRFVQAFTNRITVDHSISTNVKKAIYFHLTKPWVPGFRVIALAPADGRKDMDKWFDVPLFESHERLWYFPSMHWWKVHARASHPPDGSGCSADVHTEFLSRQGKNWEFDYANILNDGTAKLLGREDFERECWWWKRAFGA